MNFSLKNKHFALSILWFLLPAITGFLKWKNHSINNYYIYKGVFYHLIEKIKLYGLFPSEYQDCNHYGPIFSIIIAPFAIIPDYVGVPLWVVFQAFVLYKALMVLPVRNEFKWILLIITLVDLMTSSSSVQINPAVVGMIVLSWYYVKTDKIIWATFFVLLGTFIKLYGIVGLAFWVFSNQKIKYILYCIFWAVVFFALPMMISSPNFVFQSYFDWFYDILDKNNDNQFVAEVIGNRQDISIMGFTRRVLGFKNFSYTWFIIPGFLLQIATLLRFESYKSIFFQLRFLASLLIFVIIFSSSSESPTYIIATVGVAIWFITQEVPIKKWIWFMLIFVIIITSLTATDLFPTPIRRFFVFYAIKAVPCILVWLVCIFQLFQENYNSKSSKWILEN